MCKRVMIGLFAMIVVAMWWTEADAATCLKWKYFGGSNVCIKWSTKGVLLEGLFIGHDCGLKGNDCDIKATAKAELNIAFCKNDVTGKIRRVKCTKSLSFSGFADGCDPGVGDDPAEGPVCTATFVLKTDCQACCDTGEICIDATPVDMETSVNACIGLDDLKDCVEPIFPECSEKSAICTIKERCTIDRNTIVLDHVRPYKPACRGHTLRPEGTDPGWRMGPE